MRDFEGEISSPSPSLSYSSGEEYDSTSQSTELPSSNSGNEGEGSSFYGGNNAIGYANSNIQHKRINKKKGAHSISDSINKSITDKTESGSASGSQSEVIEFPLLSSKEYESDNVTGTEGSIYVDNMVDIDSDDYSDNVVSIEKQQVTRKGLSPLAKSVIIILLAVVVLFVFSYAPILGSDRDAAQKCLAILLFAAVMWATEAVPLYQTALTIPVLAVLFRVMLDPDDQTVRLPRDEALITLFRSMFSTTLMLVIAGFSMSAVLQRYKIDAFVASTILSKVVKKGPTLYIAVVLIMGFILSAIVNNITTPLLLLSFTKPHLDALPINSKLRKAVLCAIMVSANVGGMATPIASPQSAVVLEISQQYDLGINFGNFIAVAFPTGFVMIAIGFVVIRFIFFRGNIGDFPRECYMSQDEIEKIEEQEMKERTSIDKNSHRFDEDIDNVDIEDRSNDNSYISNCETSIVYDSSSYDKSIVSDENSNEEGESKVEKTKKKKMESRKKDAPVIITSADDNTVIESKKKHRKRDPALIFTYVLIGIIIVGGIVLWAIVDQIKESFGSSFIVSCLVIVLLYGTKLLPDDALVEKVPWNIILLLVGGNALGAAVRSSELLTIINDVLNLMNYLPGYVILLICCLFMWIIGSLIGHTIASLILLPIFASFVLTANDGAGIGVTAGVFVVVTNLMCSGEMCLPVSSFPNITISGLVNSEGNKIMSTGFILVFGVVMTILDMIVAMSVGFGISSAMF